MIRLEVSSGGGTLYALVLDTNDPEYYVRRNGSSEELAQIPTGISMAYPEAVARVVPRLRQKLVK